MRRVKIVATFGPAATYTTTFEAHQEGVDIARLKMSHREYPVHERVCCGFG